MWRALSNHRDNENAYVSVNGEACWSQTLSGTNGSPQCGGSSSTAWNEESVPVTCQAEAVGGKLTVAVYAHLDSFSGADESFGIDNVEISKISAGTVLLHVLPGRIQLLICFSNAVDLTYVCMSKSCSHAYPHIRAAQSLGSLNSIQSHAVNAR